MQRKNNKKIISKKAGFTIVESLVAIFILVISLTGPMVFSQSGLRASFVSRDQITAFFLAQDAIEFIKNTRDDNVLEDFDNSTTGGWLGNLDPCLSDEGCTVDTFASVNNFLECNQFTEGCITDLDDTGSDYQTLKLDSNNVFGHSGSEDSIFARHITITPDEDNPNDEVEITVYVRWSTSQTIGVRQIVVKENMFNWASGI